MTAASAPGPLPAIPPLPEGSGPAAIRAALLPEEREEFEVSYRGALAQAAESLDLADVLDTLEHWRVRAIISSDRDAYQHALTRAAELLGGGPTPEGETLAEVKERLFQLGG